MATYPTAPGYRTAIKPLTKTRTRVSESGIPRQQDLAAETAFEIMVEHPLITASEVSTLQAFYNANAYSDNTILGNDGDTYDVWFVEDYTIRAVSPTISTVSTRLVGNRQ